MSGAMTPELAKELAEHVAFARRHGLYCSLRIREWLTDQCLLIRRPTIATTAEWLYRDCGCYGDEMGRQPSCCTHNLAEGAPPHVQDGACMDYGCSFPCDDERCQYPEPNWIGVSASTYDAILTRLLKPRTRRAPLTVGKPDMDKRNDIRLRWLIRDDGLGLVIQERYYQAILTETQPDAWWWLPEPTTIARQLRRSRAVLVHATRGDETVAVVMPWLLAGPPFVWQEQP